MPIFVTPTINALPYLSPSRKTLYFLATKGDGSKSTNGTPQQLGPTVNAAPSVSVDGGPYVSVTSPRLEYDNYVAYVLDHALVGTILVNTPDRWLTTLDGDAIGLAASPAVPTVITPPLPPGPRTMKFGWNGPTAGVDMPCPLYSNMVRMGSWAPWGTPTYAVDSSDNLTSLAGTVVCQVAGDSSSNGTSKGGLPTPAGVYRVEWKTTTLSAFDLVDLNGLATVTQLTETLNAAGNVRTYQVTPPTSQYYATLYIRATQASGSCDLTNVAVYPPGEDSGSKYSRKLKAQLKTPFAIRQMDAIQVNSSNLATFSQWTPSAKVFASGDTDPVTASVSSVTAYSDPAPFFPTVSGAKLLFTTTATHPFVTGQTVRLTGASLTGLPFADGHTYDLNNLVTVIEKKSSTTFAGICGAPAALSGVNSISATASMTIKRPLPVADIVGFPKSLNAATYINTPHLFDSTQRRLLFAAVFAATSPGDKVYVERSNETWNQGVAFNQSFYDIGMAGAAGLTPAAYMARESSAVFDDLAAEATIAGRTGDIVRVLGGFWGDTTRTTAMVSWFVTNSKTFDRLVVAPYFDAGPGDSAYDAAWSLADREQVFDLAGLYLTHRNDYTSTLAGHAAAIAPITGARLACYEGGIESMCPRGTNYAAKSRDSRSDPLMQTFMNRYLYQQETQGATEFLWYSQAVAFGSDGAAFSLCYAAYVRPNQVAGDGTANLADRSALDVVDSVVGFTANQWMSEAITAPVTGTKPHSLVLPQRPTHVSFW